MRKPFHCEAIAGIGAAAIHGSVSISGKDPLVGVGFVGLRDDPIGRSEPGERAVALLPRDLRGERDEKAGVRIDRVIPSSDSSASAASHEGTGLRRNPGGTSLTAKTLHLFPDVP